MPADPQLFDYIIVGSGSAGAVLATRLSEDPGVKVLVLEAGGPNKHRLMRMPMGFFPMIQVAKVNWGYQSEPEPHLDGRQLMLPRGKVLGGSSSTNGMLYGRGHPADFQQWQQMGADGWSFPEVLPYFQRAQNSWRGASQWHGDSGPLTVSKHYTDPEIFRRFIETARRRGFPIAADSGRADFEGFGKPDFTVHRGQRGSTAERYLKPVLGRSNLTVHMRALATRVLFEGRRAVGVEYVHRGRVQQAHAQAEVLLCGGAYNSPQLLMLSGIGPADELRAAGIKPFHDLPGVGRNLQEHASFGASFNPVKPIALLEQFRFDRLAMSVIEWKLFGTGVVSRLPLVGLGFYRSRPELLRPDIEIMLNATGMDARVWFPGIRAPRGNALMCGNVLLHPQSRGWVKLRSTDPLATPRIQLNLLAEAADRATLRTAFRNMREFFSTEPLASAVTSEKFPGPSCSTDAQIDTYMRGIIGTAHHPTSTCAMGDGPDAVLNAQLQVRGLEGLRVADASAMPTVAGGHTNAVVIMIGEKAADLIRGRRMPPAAWLESVDNQI